MPATETVNGTVVDSVVDSDEAGDPYCVVIPTSAATLAGFRAWSTSDAFPEHGKITFLGGEIIVDMNAERLGSHAAVRYAVTVVVGPLVEDNNRGRFYLDGARLVNEAAELSNEPDAMAVLFDSFKSGAVRDVPTADADDWIELEGSPDWVMEILSPGSVQKDTVKLRERYHRAGIAEYWLIDARRNRLKFTILIHHPGDYQPAPQVDGWQASKVFGKEFRLVRLTDPRGRPAFRLEAR